MAYGTESSYYSLMIFRYFLSLFLSLPFYVSHTLPLRGFSHAVRVCIAIDRHSPVRLLPPLVNFFQSFSGCTASVGSQTSVRDSLAACEQRQLRLQQQQQLHLQEQQHLLLLLLLQARLLLLPQLTTTERSQYMVVVCLSVRCVLSVYMSIRVCLCVCPKTAGVIE